MYDNDYHALLKPTQTCKMLKEIVRLLPTDGTYKHESVTANAFSLKVKLYVQVDSLLVDRSFQELAVDVSAPPDQFLLAPVKGNILSVQ